MGIRRQAFFRRIAFRMAAWSPPMIDSVSESKIRVPPFTVVRIVFRISLLSYCLKRWGHFAPIRSPMGIHQSAWHVQTTLQNRALLCFGDEQRFSILAAEGHIGRAQPRTRFKTCQRLSQGTEEPDRP